MGNIFQILFIAPITNLLMFFYKMLTLANAPFALGFAIILLTILIRLVIYPFVSAQIKASAKMQKIAPLLSKLREKHKGDTKKQQEEMMRLYKEHGVNPAAGCLPMVIQLPIIWALYGVLTSALSANSQANIDKINSLLYFPFLKIEHAFNTDFFGFSLFDTPSKAISSNPFLLLIPLLTGVFQFILSKMMMPEKAKLEVKKKENNDKTSDFQSAFMTQTLYIFPIMIGIFSYTLPVGLSLYWNTYTIFGILQQYLLVGPGGIKPWIEKIKGYRK